MITIHLLRLRDGKYYVGKTMDAIGTIQYFVDNGPTWIKIYEPIEIMTQIFDCELGDENKYTLMYMDQLGVENVRGGSFSNPHLTTDELNVISNYINNTRINHTISYAQPMPSPGPYLIQNTDKIDVTMNETQPYLVQDKKTPDILTNETQPYLIQDKKVLDTQIDEKQPYMIQNIDLIVLPKIETKPYLIYESQHN